MVKIRGDLARIYFVGFLIVVLIVLIIVVYTKDCGDDKSCFDERAGLCEKVKGEFVSEGNYLMLYEVRGEKKGYCVVRITLIEVRLNADLNASLQGRGMICEVPFDVVENNSLIGLEGLSSYCSGPLKREMLQIDNDKAYRILVRTIDEESVKKLKI